MNCEMFESCIDDAFKNYGEIGVEVDLLTVADKHTETPPFDWVDVTLRVAPVVPHPEYRAETWHYGGLISVTTGPVPMGIQVIDREKLISCCEAAKKLPPGFPLSEAHGSLYWAVNPECKEPIYVFQAGETSITVGAYTGTVGK